MHVAVKRYFALEDPVAFVELEDLEMFIRSTMCSGALQPPSDFRDSVLKRLIVKFEDLAKGDTLEEMYSLIKGSYEPGFATYFCGEFTDPVTMRVKVGGAQRQLVVEGSTGFRVWEASRYLASYLVRNPQVIDGKKVVELGSGSGFCGLVAAKLGATVTLTDAHSGVLQLLEETSRDLYGVSVEVLDWEARPIIDIATDVVIGSDIVYDPRLVSPLVDVLDAVQYEFALICCAIRRLSSLELFESCLQAKGLRYTKLVADNSSWDEIRYDNFFVDDRSDVDLVLYQVSR